jgi:hypothetical protein
MKRRPLREIHATMAALVLALAGLAAWSVSTFQEVMREDGPVDVTDLPLEPVME